jgi:hypothetical protein
MKIYAGTPKDLFQFHKPRAVRCFTQSVNYKLYSYTTKVFGLYYGNHLTESEKGCVIRKVDMQNVS